MSLPRSRPSDGASQAPPLIMMSLPAHWPKPHSFQWCHFRIHKWSLQFWSSDSLPILTSSKQATCRSKWIHSLWSSHKTTIFNSNQSAFLATDPNEPPPQTSYLTRKKKKWASSQLPGQQLVETMTIFWTQDVEWCSVTWLHPIVESCPIHIHSGSHTFNYT